MGLLLNGIAHNVASLIDGGLTTEDHQLAGLNFQYW